MIDKDTIARYHRDGYIVVENLLDESTRQRMKAVLAGLVEGARKVDNHNDVYDLEPTHSPEEPRVRRIKKPHVIDPVFAEFIRSPKLLSVLSALLGPSGVRLHGSKLNLKAPEFGSPVEWHQDWAFYPHTNDDVLATGVMLDDMQLINGPLMVIPGSHKGPTYDHHDGDGYFCGAMAPDRDGIDFSKAVPITGPAGSVSFHHVRLIHGSAQNRSKVSRNLLLYEFSAADAMPLLGTGNWSDFNSRLLTGAATVNARVVECPVRLPMPPAKHQGSIYENQTATGKRYFEMTQSERAALRV